MNNNRLLLFIPLGRRTPTQPQRLALQTLRMQPGFAPFALHHNFIRIVITLTIAVFPQAAEPPLPFFCFVELSTKHTLEDRFVVVFVPHLDFEGTANCPGVDNVIVIAIDHLRSSVIRKTTLGQFIWPVEPVDQQKSVSVGGNSDFVDASDPEGDPIHGTCRIAVINHDCVRSNQAAVILRILQVIPSVRAHLVMTLFASFMTGGPSSGLRYEPSSPIDPLELVGAGELDGTAVELTVGTPKLTGGPKLESTIAELSEIPEIAGMVLKLPVSTVKLSEAPEVTGTAVELSVRTVKRKSYGYF
ncbi:hypothetical protein FPQ18DRAFT_386148 [Pyronema domesticum]|nr:hypothetical protein FPQ18DRAFT_386148 [Pyronema domesticum]